MTAKNNDYDRKINDRKNNDYDRKINDRKYYIFNNFTKVINLKDLKI